MSKLPRQLVISPFLQHEIVRSDAVGIGKDSVGAVALAPLLLMVTKIAIFDAHHTSRRIVRL